MVGSMGEVVRIGKLFYFLWLFQDIFLYFLFLLRTSNFRIPGTERSTSGLLSMGWHSQTQLKRLSRSSNFRATLPLCCILDIPGCICIYGSLLSLGLYHNKFSLGLLKTCLMLFPITRQVLLVYIDHLKIGVFSLAKGVVNISFLF